jgi:hypothetical protein
MPRHRVYVPFTLERLPSLLADGELGPVPFVGYAVTPDVVAQTVDSDDEEREHLVALVAARASLVQVVNDPAASWRRVVVAVDVDGAALIACHDDDSPAAVEISRPPALQDVAALFVDGEASETVVALASQTRDLGMVDDLDLLWFAPTELGDLLR